MPPPLDGADPLLTLSICKPAIRRTAQPGDRLLGITSVALAQREGYPLGAVIYSAQVARTLDFGAYYALENGFGQRPDCIYRLDPETGRIVHAGRSRLHTEPGYLARDLGREPVFRNARTLLCEQFRYFGSKAVVIPARFPQLRQIADALGQGHRVFEETAPEAGELDRLFALLWRRETRFTPASVEGEAPGHAPRRALREPS